MKLMHENSPYFGFFPSLKPFDYEMHLLIFKSSNF